MFRYLKDPWRLDDEGVVAEPPVAAPERDASTGRRWTVVRLLIASCAVVAVLGGAAIALDTFDRTKPAKFCTADGMLGPDGEVYGRDPDQDCKFVDEDGRVLPGQ